MSTAATPAIASLINPPPAPKPLPTSVPPEIESAALAYLDAARVADLTYAALRLMDRDGAGYATAHADLMDRERAVREARRRLEEALGEGEGCWPVGGWLIRRVNVLSGGSVLRVDRVFCDWPRGERTR